MIVEALNPDGRIRSNMSAKTRFKARRPQVALLVHKDAIVNTADGAVVYVARNDSATMHSIHPSAPRIHP